MITIRRSIERGHANHGWLDTYHSFSFADYYDPKHVHFRSLRVLNEDRVAPGKGFGMHPHRDMEIVTYMLDGALEHRDSMGNGAVLRAGDVQYMAAGTGIMHSEFNASILAPAHLIQIWILPASKGLSPRYEQTAIPVDFSGGLFTIASPEGGAGATRIHQDASIAVGRLAPGKPLTIELAPDRHGWMQITRGALSCDGVDLSAGDAAAVSEEDRVTVEARERVEFLWFDLA